MLFGFSVCFAAASVGYLALKTSPVDKIGAYGLIQALSPLYYAALALLIVSFAWNLRSELHREALLSAHLVVLVFLVHGAPAVIEGSARFQTAYLHVGFIGYIANTGDVLPGFDARFSWPSFFEAVAMLDKVGGVNSAEVFLRWWPVAMNLLYLPFIYRIAKQLLRSELKAWVAAALFPLADWVGQDYFSPQSLAYLLYLAFIFILVVPFGTRDQPAWQTLYAKLANVPGMQTLLGKLSGAPADGHGRASGAPHPYQGTRRAVPVGFYLAASVLLLVAIATSHQLTPFMAIISATVLVIAGRTRVRGIVVVAALITVGWICYGAVTFWSTHIYMMIGGFGNVGGNVGSGVGARVVGNAAHQHVIDSRLLISAFMWSLAGLGALVWRPKNGDRAVIVLLFLAAFSMAAGGDYGGEGVLRIYLFSLPGAVCLIAALISRLPKFSQGQVAFVCVLLLLTPLFLVARWGNELYEMARPGELATTTELYKMAAPGSNLISLNSFITWNYEDLDEFNEDTVELDTLGAQTLPEITATVAGNPRGGYVILTADQEEYGWLANGLPENWGATVENMLARSPDYTLRYKNPDGVIFQYTPHPVAKKKQGKKS